MGSIAIRHTRFEPRGTLQLQQEHRDCQVELRKLTRKAYLTPTEHERARVLKKRKLLAKDHIARLIHSA